MMVKPRSAALAGVDIAILAGGLGTRIRGVLGEVPKLLAPVNGRPFFDHLIDWLEGMGGERFVLCLGHLADKVTEHLGPSGALKIETVIENDPLGTAGALRGARLKLLSKTVLVMNGDSWADVDLRDFLNCHLCSGAELTILCIEVDDCSRYGSVTLDARGFISKFVEKSTVRTGAGLINGGLYLFTQKGLDRLAGTGGASLEKEFFGKLPAGTINAYISRGRAFIDIGIPENLIEAGKILA